MSSSYDWMKLLGTKPLLKPDGTTLDVKGLGANVDVIGLYFSAHWCPPCRGFTPVFASHYKKAQSSETSATAEIVFVSSDRDESSFDAYRKEMPWLALDFSERDTKAELSKQFGVSGIPSLVFLDAKTGSVLTKSGRSIVMSEGSNFAAKAAGAKAEKDAALKKLKSLDIFADGSTNVLKKVRAADIVVAAFGDDSNRGWAEFVKPKLKTVCAELKKDSSRNVEVVYIPCDDNGTSRNEDCWTSLKSRHNLSAFSACLESGPIEAPHILVLDAKKGEIIVEDAARSCYDTGIEGFPWNDQGLARFAAAKKARMDELKKSMRDLKLLSSAKIIDGSGASVSVDDLKKNNEVIGLYFSAHWCGPCRGFTPQLAKMYDSLKKAGKKIEIIFCSSDSDASSFQSYFDEMPWNALDYGARDLKEKLSEMYGVSGIPTLVLLRSDGTEITTSGRSAIMSGVDGFPFTDEAIAEAKKKVAAREEADAKAMRDAGRIVFRRHRGEPGSSTFDAKTNTIDFKAFDTFAGDATQSVKSGKYFYEITCVNVDRGVAQVGWASATKFPSTTQQSGEGVGDDDHSWGFDGNRTSKWHAGNSTNWGAAWKTGDVFGCAVDMDAKKIYFGLNGKWSAPWGAAFEGIKADAVVPAVTGQGANYKLKVNFGDLGAFAHGPPDASFAPLSKCV